MPDSIREPYPINRIWPVKPDQKQPGADERRKQPAKRSEDETAEEEKGKGVEPASKPPHFDDYA